MRLASSRKNLQNCDCENVWRCNMLHITASRESGRVQLTHTTLLSLVSYHVTLLHKFVLLISILSEVATNGLWKRGVSGCCWRHCSPGMPESSLSHSPLLQLNSETVRDSVYRILGSVLRFQLQHSVISFSCGWNYLIAQTGPLWASWW